MLSASDKFVNYAMQYVWSERGLNICIRRGPRSSNNHFTTGNS